MKEYIGIDLGTTNSVIATYDLKEVKVWKSPEQNDVTPSAIYVNKKGNKYYGISAYNKVAFYPEDTATLFKRLLGTKKIFDFKASGLRMTPEECSTEIIQILLGYIPDNIKKDENIGAVITVPANFDTIKKNATLESAKMAGLKNIVLIQEPMAAVIAAQRQLDAQGIYIVYDLGGGTFDATIAKSEAGKIHILANGGIDMCGGRDIDLAIYEQIVKPWLNNNFDIDFENVKYKNIKSIACSVIETAKKELSGKKETQIMLLEEDMNLSDENGEDIYLEVDINRDMLKPIITSIVDETVNEILKNVKKAGISIEDISEIIFIGGPTNYTPLKEEVSNKLGIPYNDKVNPMTAVAEGASIYAESIEWKNEKHHKKSSIDKAQLAKGIEFSYYSRVTTNKISVIPIINSTEINNNYYVEITSKDTGWNSGRIVLENKKMIEIPVQKEGNNEYQLIILDSNGNKLDTKQINVVKTLTSVDTIPASHSIGIEVKDSLYGNNSVLEYLIEEGENLPKTGEIKLKTTEALKAQENKSINFNLWEGSNKNKAKSNRYIGCLKINGTDFDYGIINKFSDIICKYEISDGGSIKLNVEIPDINSVFGQNQNFYSRQEGKIGIEDIDTIITKGERLLEKIETVKQVVENENIEKARKKIVDSMKIRNNVEATEEDVQRAENDLLQAKDIIYNEEKNKDNLKKIRQTYLEEEKNSYRQNVVQLCDEIEKIEVEKLIKIAQEAIEMDYDNFDNILSELDNRLFNIMFWKNDEFAIEYFQKVCINALYTDSQQAKELISQGKNKIAQDNIEELRSIIIELSKIRINNNFYDSYETNIIRGG